MKKLFFIVALLVLTGCSSSSDVDWENYSPTVKIRIDELIASKDCVGLQAQFEITAGNDVAQRNRVGDGNADLMGYIDAGMRSSGCY